MNYQSTKLAVTLAKKENYRDIKLSVIFKQHKEKAVFPQTKQGEQKKKSSLCFMLIQ